MEIKYNEENEIEYCIEKDLAKNIEILEAVFSDWGDLVQKKFCLKRRNGNIEMYILYIDGLTDNEMVERTITRPLLYEWRDVEDEMTESVFDTFFHKETEAVDLTETDRMMEAVSAVLKGDTAIFVSGDVTILYISKGWNDKYI